jgi:hypothetical protein
MPNFYNRLKARKFTSVSDTAVEISAYNSATPNFTIDAGGKLNWSSGSATADTNLYRGSADVLSTDDSFNVASGKAYKINNTDILTSTSLGSSVISSSLTSVGSLTGLTAATPSFSGPFTSAGASTFSSTVNVNTSLTAATPSFTGPFTSAGASTFQNTVVLQQSLEKVNVGTSPSATTNIDVLTSAVHYYTTSYSTGITLEIRPSSSSVNLNTLMSTNQSLTVVFIMKSGNVNGKVSALTINGVSQTIKWFGGSAPAGSAGDALDAYTFTIIKTDASTYTVLGSQSKFA